jgi:hypothetical protein
MLDSVPNRLGIFAGALSIAGAITQAARVDKALADSEARRKAAENGVREINVG